MYNDQTAQISENTMLEGIVSTAFNYLNSQESTIQSIEDKLNKILSRPTPESKLNTGVSPVAVDFVQRANGEMYRLQLNNGRLESILKHLSEII